MNVWIINPYGNLPAENWRPHRSYTVAKAFLDQGHIVSYWISNIDHRSKNERTASNEHGNNFKIIIVPSTIYSEHISLRRIKFEINFIRNFKSLAEKEDSLPDLILIGEPSLFISFHFISFVKKYKLKFVIDMIDIWPELFKLVLPNFFKPFHKIIFFPFYLKRSWFIKKANGILSVSKAYLEIAIKINKNVPCKLIYWGVDLESFNIIDKSLIYKSNDCLKIIYAGTLGDNYDIKSIINCARSIKEKKMDIFIYIAGDGNLKQFLLDSIKHYELHNVKYLGRLTPDELISIYQNCHLAFSTYNKESSVSMPIKAFDYFAAGLPLLNSLGMDLGEIVSEYQVGINYQAGNDIDLLEKILIFYNDRILLSKMKENCFVISKKFDQSILYKEYVDFCTHNF